MLCTPPYNEFWSQAAWLGLLALLLLISAQLCPILCNPMDSSPLGLYVLGIFFRQEYWSELPFPSPGNLLNSGITPGLLCLLHWQADSYH